MTSFSEKFRETILRIRNIIFRKEEDEISEDGRKFDGSR